MSSQFAGVHSDSEAVFDPNRKDFSGELDAIVAQSTELCASKGTEEAINLCLTLEKRCRNGNDWKTLKSLCLHMVQLCKGKKDWLKLNAVLMLIHKRNTQQRMTISAMVEEAMKYITDTPDVETRIELIKTLKEICEGKIYVEAESAHLHFMLSVIYEAKGDVDQACDVVQDVHVETYGALSKKEKVTYILEQVRLNLLKKDFIRTKISSRKMNEKFLEEKGFEEEKIRYNNYMVEYYTHQKDAWRICQCYWKIAASATESVQRNAIESTIIFLLMSKFDVEQNDMMHRASKALTDEYKNVQLDPLFGRALKLFTTAEIIPTPFPGQQQLEAHPALELHKALAPDNKAYMALQLSNRVVQHNLRTVAKYYKAIKMSRLAELLGLSTPQLEAHLSEVAQGFDLYLKIDRPKGVISFQEKKSPEEVLSDWSSDISSLLGLMESTCHLINRETMVNKAVK